MYSTIFRSNMENFPTYFTGEHALSMTLRDYFAIKIVQAMISNNKIYEIHPDEKSIIKDAYIIADQMIEARNDS